MCDAASVGKEHVPPKCLFPEESRYRESLIKVPSCDKHNSGKSTDDQLLRWVLASTNANSEIARRVLNEGVAPSFAKKPHLLKTFLPDFQAKVSDSGMFKSIFKLDFERFRNSITSIARGLYYHHTWHSHKALGPMEIFWDSPKGWQAALKALNLPDSEYETFTKQSPKQPRCPLGANPKVFQYGFDLQSDPKHAVCIMRFYEGQAMFVRWENSLRQYSTKLKSLGDYLKKFGNENMDTRAELPEGARADLMHQLDERDAQLAVIMKEAKHQRDFGAFTLIKMLRADINEKKKMLRATVSGRHQEDGNLDRD
jgi:hypothetical protein